MQYLSTHFIEPRIEQRSDDIREFISQQPEPGRSICEAVLLNGEKISRVAKKKEMSHYKILRIIRDMMRPVAIDYGIIVDTPDPDRDHPQRYFPTPQGRIAPGEVVEN